MPFAKLSAENRIEEKQAALGITLNFLAAISGVSPTKLSQAFNGIRQLENLEATKVLSVLDELSALTEACRPFPVELKNPAVIRQLLNARRNGDFFIAVGLRGDDTVGSNQQA
jgi:DNA-binding transcriptional regulator YdaS (Cro superfamily)